MLRFNPNACTDITGFGLAGHVLEMAKGSNKRIVLHTASIPYIAQAKEYAQMGLIPAGAYSIKSFCEKSVTIEPSVETVLCDLIFDPQTSGGLVVSLAEEDADKCLKAMTDEGINASIIGEVTGNHPNGHVSIV